MAIDAEGAWQQVELRDLVTQPVTYGIVKPGPEGAIPLVRATDLTGGRITRLQLRTVEERRHAEYSRTHLETGDLLIGLVGSPGEVALVPPELAGANVNRAVGLIRLDQARVDPRFVRAFFRGPGRQRILNEVVGSVQQVVNLRDLSRILVTLPPLPQQHAIASVLGALDDKIESNRRLWRGLHDLLPLLYEACVAHADGWFSVGDLGTVVGGGTPKSSEPSYWEPREVAWITPKDMTALDGVPVIEAGARRISTAGLDSSSAKLLPQGAVVYTSRATLGVIAITEAPLATNQGFISVVPDRRLGTAFVYSSLTALREQINGKANGSTFMEVNKTNFKSVDCPFPAADRLTAFRRRADPILDQIAAVVRESWTLTAIRDALLPKLVSGQIRVPLCADPEEQIGAAIDSLPAADNDTRTR